MIYKNISESLIEPEVGLKLFFHGGAINPIVIFWLFFSDLALLAKKKLTFYFLGPSNGHKGHSYNHISPQNPDHILSQSEHIKKRAYNQCVPPNHNL